jgi:hypothetical protein
MVIAKLMTGVTKDGYTIKKYKKENNELFNEIVV